MMGNKNEIKINLPKEGITVKRTVTIDGQELINMLASQCEFDMSREVVVRLNIRETGDVDRGTFKRELKSIVFTQDSIQD